jgi:hypothetical protein
MLRLAFLGLAMFGLVSSPAYGKTYILSLRELPLEADESIESFSLKTWGVEFKAVCHIPSDWELTAGRTGPLGKLEGQAGHGASQLGHNRLRELRGLAIVELSGPVQTGQQGTVPATFAGEAKIHSGRAATARTMQLSSTNVQLTPSGACPAVR